MHRKLNSMLIFFILFILFLLAGLRSFFWRLSACFLFCGSSLVNLTGLSSRSMSLMFRPVRFKSQRLAVRLKASSLPADKSLHYFTCFNIFFNSFFFTSIIVPCLWPSGMAIFVVMFSNVVKSFVDDASYIFFLYES